MKKILSCMVVLSVSLFASSAFASSSEAHIVSTPSEVAGLYAVINDISSAVSEWEHETGNHEVAGYLTDYLNELSSASDAEYYEGLVQMRNEVNQMASFLNTSSVDGMSSRAAGQVNLRIGALKYAESLRFAAGDSTEKSDASVAMASATASTDWTVFAQTSIEWADQEDTKHRSGYNYTLNTVSVGVDKWLNDRVLAGVVLGIQDSNSESAPYTSTDNLGLSIGAYASMFGDRWTVDASLSYGHINNESQRGIYFGTTNLVAQSDFDTETLSAHIGGEYRIPTKYVDIAVFGAFQFTDMDSDSYSEDGAFGLNLHVSDYDEQSYVTDLGVRFTKEMAVKSITIIPELSFTWSHEYNTTLDDSSMYLEAAPTVSFKSETDDAIKDTFVIGAGVSTQWNARLSSFLRYDATFGEGDFEAHSISSGMQWTF